MKRLVQGQASERGKAWIGTQSPDFLNLLSLQVSACLWSPMTPGAMTGERECADVIVRVSLPHSPSCVTFGKLLKLSEPGLPPL